MGCFVLWHINPFRVIQRKIKFLKIQSCINIVFVYKQLNVKTVLFQTIQFSISTQFSSVWPIDRTLSGATTLDQWTWEQCQWRGILHSPKLQHYWNLTIRLFSVISRILIGGRGVLPLCKEAVGVFYSPIQLGNPELKPQVPFSVTQDNFFLRGGLTPQQGIQSTYFKP